MPSERFVLLRQLGARYWKPITSLVAIVLPAWKALNDLSGDSLNRQSWLAIGVGLFVIIIIRFPRIAIAITRAILGPSKPLSDLPMIFRGPRPYNSDDRNAFPGRQKEIADCWMFIQQHRFFVIDGESGCGKSSLLNAAILPRAREKFALVECRIADDPLGKLRSALLKKPYRKREQAVSEGELLEALDAAAKSSGDNTGGDAQAFKPLLLCIDQFEELFTTVKDRTRNQFLGALKEAINNGKIRLVIAIRSDFFDLLIKICDSVDPERETVNLGNYYTLRAFRKEQAEAVLDEMLAPVHANNPLLMPQIEDFAKALVRELLRPPRDKRLCKDDEKSVLPVELQTVGMMIESFGNSYFSVAGLKRLGGKLGLLRAYIEDAKTYVWRKTAVSGEKALLILRQLISPAQTKWAQTPQSVAMALNLPPIQVKKVLDAFAEKYLVNPLMVIADEANAGQTAPAEQYELMHEHLVQILIEAPDPILQKARDAEERLRFWNDRTRVLHRPATEDKKNSLRRRNR